MTATLISPMPTFEPAESLAEHREALARRAAWRLEDASPETIIRWAVRTFGSRFAITSSMADAVLIDLVARHAPGTDVVFLDTGYHFAETLTMRDAVAATYRGRINLISVEPEQTVAEQDAEHGRDLFGTNPDRCCFLRKVVPLRNTLAGYNAWVTGVRRVEAPTRANTPLITYDEKHELVKLNPLAAWSDEEMDAYIAEHHVLVNPLVDEGYPSIGCRTCTVKPLPGADPRSGRWAGIAKTECGLHA